MKVTTRAKDKFVSGAAKGGQSAIRDWIEGGPTVKDTQKQARETIKDTERQARETLKDARKEARRRLIRARIAAARVRAGARTTSPGLSAKAVGAAAAAGLALGFFLDPNSGKRRRHVVRDRALALIRRGTGRTRQQAERLVHRAEGKVEAARSKTRHHEPAANDQALADRVKSEIFQPADAPKGSVNVNVEDGVVYLRGEVNRPEQIRKLVEEAGHVDGVRGVESLLHT
jgi:osmotically-inducible protein OsmY